MAHDPGLIRLYLEASGRGVAAPSAKVLHWDCSIAEDPASCAPTAGDATRETSVRFLAKVIRTRTRGRLRWATDRSFVFEG